MSIFCGVAALFFAAAAHGRPGVDTYPRQPIDVQHYHFTLQLTDSTDRIVGEATVRARVLPPGISTLSLDLANTSGARQGRGMQVTAVSRAGRALRYTHADDRLVITLDSSA
ncbi:MAG: hypothetical protein ABIT38_13635, partial [Gemmatimonadaceae bacterium]